MMCGGRTWQMGRRSEGVEAGAGAGARTFGDVVLVGHKSCCVYPHYKLWSLVVAEILGALRGLLLYHCVVLSCCVDCIWTALAHCPPSPLQAPLRSIHHRQCPLGVVQSNLCVRNLHRICMLCWPHGDRSISKLCASAGSSHGVTPACGASVSFPH